MGEEERALWRKSVRMWKRQTYLFGTVVCVQSIMLIALGLANLTR
jgi:hypothetical protein